MKKTHILTVAQVPSFFLFGEAPRPVDDHFMHLEPLDHRSRSSDWNIRAHAHDTLNHVFFIRSGGGMMSADSMGFSFVGGDFLVVPAGVVHGFQFEPETQGMVTTIADKLLQDLLSRDPGLVTLFDSPAIYRNEELGQIDLDLDKLNNELAWTTSYSRLAVETRLLSVLIELARSKALTASGPLRRGRPQLKLVGRFRHLLEQELRTHLSVEAYADKLAVTTTQLRRACQRATGRSPSRLIQERLTIEAKRTLCYSNMTVGEVAGHLGFDDPAYFSRFFTKMTDMAPNRYRDQHQKVVEVGAHKN